MYILKRYNLRPNLVIGNYQKRTWSICSFPSEARVNKYKCDDLNERTNNNNNVGLQ